MTLTLKDGRTIAGYVFDRRTGRTLAESAVRIMPANERTKLTIPYSDIAALAFTGRDTAAGKTFEAWVRKYWEKKAAGREGHCDSSGVTGVGGTPSPLFFGNSVIHSFRRAYTL